MVLWMRKGQGSDKHHRSGISAGHSALACECLEGLHTKKSPVFQETNLCGHLASSKWKHFSRLSISACGIQVWTPISSNCSNVWRITGKPCEWMSGGLFNCFMQNNLGSEENAKEFLCSKVQYCHRAALVTHWTLSHCFVFSHKKQGYPLHTALSHGGMFTQQDPSQRSWGTPWVGRSHPMLQS